MSSSPKIGIKLSYTVHKYPFTDLKLWSGPASLFSSLTHCAKSYFRFLFAGYLLPPLRLKCLAIWTALPVLLVTASLFLSPVAHTFCHRSSCDRKSVNLIKSFIGQVCCCVIYILFAIFLGHTLYFKCASDSFCDILICNS